MIEVLLILLLDFCTLDKHAFHRYTLPDFSAVAIYTVNLQNLNRTSMTFARDIRTFPRRENLRESSYVPVIGQR